jgi:hypothetical protein
MFEQRVNLPTMSEEQEVKGALAMAPAELDAEVDRVIAYLNLESRGDLLPDALSIVDSAMRQEARKIQNLPLHVNANISGFSELMRRPEVQRGALKIVEWHKRQLSHGSLHA